MHTAMHLAAIPDADVDDRYDPNDVARDLLTFLPQPSDQVRYGRSEWASAILKGVPA